MKAARLLRFSLQKVITNDDLPQSGKLQEKVAVVAATIAACGW